MMWSDEVNAGIQQTKDALVETKDRLRPTPSPTFSVWPSDIANAQLVSACSRRIGHYVCGIAVAIAAINLINTLFIHSHFVAVAALPLLIVDGVLLYMQSRMFKKHNQINEIRLKVLGATHEP